MFLEKDFLNESLNQNSVLDSLPNYTLFFNTSKVAQPDVPCFKDDSKILCYKNDSEVYIKIQDLKKGDLVKTSKDGYLPIFMIGTTKIYNPKNNIRSKNRLYKCSPQEFPELTEELIITGCHSILVDQFKDEIEREKTIEVNGKIYITDNFYRLPACVDERTEPYLDEGLFRIWHIALENDNYYFNYGIYANGLLVESCSKRYLKELSGMDIIK